MTHVKTLYIGRGSFTVSLECGHVQCVDGWHSIPRPGSDYDCPDCRAETCSSAVTCPSCQAQQTALLAASFTPVELDHLKFYRWMRQTGRSGS
jgi:hypothetical protein